MHCISIDLGGTYIKAGLCRIKSEKDREQLKIIILKKIVVLTKNSSASDLLLQLEQIIKQLSDIVKGQEHYICIGVPGKILGNNVSTANLPFKKYDLKKKLQQRFKYPVFMENDAKLFALYEAVLGAGRKNKIVLGVTIGTGLGCGIVIDGKIYRGKGTAGEIGHGTIQYQVNDVDARIGKHVPGELEEYVSNRGIVLTAKENGLRCKTAEEVFLLAEKGNKAARKTLEETGTMLGYGLLNAANTLDPDIIVIGGGVSKAWKYMRKPCEQILKKAVNKVRVVKSQNADAGMLGAGLLCNQNP